MYDFLEKNSKMLGVFAVIGVISIVLVMLFGERIPVIGKHLSRKSAEEFKGELEIEKHLEEAKQLLKQE